MNKKQMLDLLRNMKEDEIFESKIHDRVLIIDGLNLFFFSQLRYDEYDKFRW